MKCPKCGYISFDYNQVCPKCTKDITAEQSRMNIPSYKPDPPSLLGSLTGDASDSSMGLRTGALEREEGFIPEDSQVFESTELPFEDSPDREIHIDVMPQEGVHFQSEESSEEPSVEMEDLVLDDIDIGAPETEQVTADEIASSDLEDLSGDEIEIAFDEEVAVGGEVTDSEVEKAGQEEYIRPDDSPTIMDIEETELFDEGQDLETALEPEGGLPPGIELKDEESEAPVKPEEISLEDLEGLLSVSETENEIGEEPEAEKELVTDSTGEEEELMIDLDDFLLDESVSQAKTEQEEIQLDTSEINTSENDNKEVEQ